MTLSKSLSTHLCPLSTFNEGLSTQTDTLSTNEGDLAALSTRYRPLSTQNSSLSTPMETLSTNELEGIGQSRLNCGEPRGYECEVPPITIEPRAIGQLLSPVLK